uniref:Secretory calcium-binding phosphoprotein 9 n=1 Tax=Globodera pallida TaxID=36090 RepID=A0A183BS39_GLOPA
MKIFRVFFLIWHLNATLGILFAPSPCSWLLNRGIGGGVYPNIPYLNMPVAGFQDGFAPPIGGLPAVLPPLQVQPFPIRTLCSPPALCAPPLAAMPAVAPMLNIPAAPPPSPLAPIVPNFWVPPPRILQPPQPAMAPSKLQKKFTDGLSLVWEGI